MEKIIHYCWFGGNPLPKMAKKCIESWKKFLPDFEIKEWNEKNFDINICPFVKEAYEKKKWAFVSDYARVYALYNYGGIYFDTDLEVLNNINFLFENDIFMGWEDDKCFSTAVIGVKNKKDRHIKEILEYYEKLDGFDADDGNIFQYANPKIITDIFTKYNKKVLDNGVQIYDDSIHVYPREYFCPLSYDYSEKLYTENTCMVHYFNATWTPKGEKIAIGVYRKFGNKRGKKILDIYYKMSSLKYRIIEFFKRKLKKIELILSIHLHINKRVNNIKKILDNQCSDYVAIYNPDWIGVGNATKDMFADTIPLREQYTKKEAKKMAEAIGYKKKLVIFNAFSKGWEYIAEELKIINPQIVIKVLLHGSHALLSEEYDWYVFDIVLDLYNKKIIDEVGTVKESLYQFYKAKGIKTSFIMNTVKIENKEKYKNNNLKNDVVKVGMYVSGDRWVKNIYNQVSAISLIQNAELDCVPLNNKVVKLAKHLELNVYGTYENVSREELFKRMAKNDVNLYVTFTECAPLIPLESLELGVPCITGDNHHYFENTELEKYLVVSKEDNIMAIYDKIKYVLENKEYIMQLYANWKKQYDEDVEKRKNDFVNQ